MPDWGMGDLGMSRRGAVPSASGQAKFIPYGTVVDDPHRQDGPAASVGESMLEGASEVDFLAAWR